MVYRLVAGGKDILSAFGMIVQFLIGDLQLGQSVGLQAIVAPVIQYHFSLSAFLSLDFILFLSYIEVMRISRNIRRWESLSWTSLCTVSVAIEDMYSSWIKKNRSLSWSRNWGETSWTNKEGFRL